MELEIIGEGIRSQFYSYSLNSRKVKTWHSPVQSKCLAAGPAHNGPAIESPAPWREEQWEAAATQAPQNAEPQAASRRGVDSFSFT